MGLIGFKEYKSKRSAGAKIEALKVTNDVMPNLAYYLFENNHWYSLKKVFKQPCSHNDFSTRIQLKVQDVMRREIEVNPGDWLVKDQEEGFYYVLDDNYFKENYQEGKSIGN